MKTRLRQMYQHKYNTTAAYEKRIILFLDLVNQKSLIYITGTLKQKLQLVLPLIPNQATLYNNKNSSIPVPAMLSTQSTIKVNYGKNNTSLHTDH
jgi:hypothetical protein